MNYVYIFVYVELDLHPWDETDFIVMDKLFDVLLDPVCQYFIKYFFINAHNKYWPEIFIFSCDSVRFLYQDDVGLIK